MQGRRFEGGGGGSVGGGADRVAPVKVGAELDVRIEGVGEKGDGIAKVQGFVLFIPGVRAGDEVRIRVTRVLAKVGFAEVLSKKEKSEDDESSEESEEYGEESDDKSEEKSGKREESEDYEIDDSGKYEDSENF
jgi:predicted RNA-binding protein with TRAM domain